MSTSQTIWRWLNAGDYPPPKKTAPSGQCWLCGSDTGAAAWPRKEAIAPTFTDYARAGCLDSNSVCQACVALSSSAGWGQYVRAYPDRGFLEHFPLKENSQSGKPRPVNWLYYSHVFTPMSHECPYRPRWRELLQVPPEPPFVFCLAVSGQKQIIFKSRINQSRDLYAVQADDDELWIDRQQFIACLQDFEQLYALGFSKDSILSGNYHHGQLLKVGMAVWRPLEDKIKVWRQIAPSCLFLAHFCAQKQEIEQPAETSEPATAPVAPMQPGEQLSLF